MYWQQSASGLNLSLRSNGLVLATIGKVKCTLKKDPRGHYFTVEVEGKKVDKADFQSFEEAKEWVKLALIARLMEASTIQRPD